MKVLNFVAAIALAQSARATLKLEVSDIIKDCPSLSPRSEPAKSVHDLRIDDIKVIGALGDSVTAGFRIKNYNRTAITDYLEYRGLSYTIGGAKGAFSITNYIKHYQPNLIVYSNGTHFVENCSYEFCNGIYTPEIDQLNAAQSGAGAKHLNRELDYVIKTMKTMKGVDFENDWKMINIQIGSNDACHACNSPFANEVTVEKYGAYVDAAIDRIRTNIPKVFVNLIGAFHVDPPYSLEVAKAYCNPNRINLCPCIEVENSLQEMYKVVDGYNAKLQDIYFKHFNNKSDSFAVTYQHGNFNFDFPIDFYSNVDCRHPSVIGQKWLSLVVWDQLFTPQADKPAVVPFSYEKKFYCPTDFDRLVTY